MTEQYLCSPVVIYTNEYSILELQVINAENRLLLQEMQAQKFLPCPNTPKTFIRPFWLKAMTLIRMKDFQ